MSRLIDPMEPMEYINHPNEVLRLLRYFVRPQMDPEERILPEYPADPKLGVVISTYGSIPFLDLNLHYLVNVNHLRVLIHDDCSPARNELIALCQRYAPHVDLYSTAERMWHKEKIGVIGDTNSFLVGLQWAQQNGFDLLLKLSRRMVALKEFASEFSHLKEPSDQDLSTMDQNVKDLIEQGKSYREIASTLGISKSYVGKIAMKIKPLSTVHSSTAVDTVDKKA